MGYGVWDMEYGVLFVGMECECACVCVCVGAPES